MTPTPPRPPGPPPARPPGRPPGPPPRSDPTPATQPAPEADATQPAPEADATQPAPPPPPTSAPGRTGGKRGLFLAIGLIAIAGAGIGVAAIASSGDDGGEETSVDLPEDPQLAEPAAEPEGVTGPCLDELDVLSAADIEAEVGLTVSEGVREGDATSCDFDIDGSTLSVTIERYDDPAAVVQTQRDVSDDEEDVAGVGEEAIYMPGLDQLYARSDDILVTFFYTGVDEAFTVDTFSALALTAFQRLGLG